MDGFVKTSKEADSSRKNVEGRKDEQNKPSWHNVFSSPDILLTLLSNLSDEEMNEVQLDAILVTPRTSSCDQ